MSCATPDPAEPRTEASLRPGVVLVTGGAGGIGQAVVRAVLKTGTTVVATDRDEAALTLLRATTSAGEGTRAAEPSSRRPEGRLHTRTLDVRDPTAIEAIVEDVEREVGPIDGLVNAHGILRAGSALAQVDEDWQLVHDVNVGGVMRVSRAVTRRMATRQRGAVVTIGSNAAAVARDGLSAYASSKAAARHYTLCLGVELAPLGVRCNVVSPGSTDTPMLRGAWPDGERDAAGAEPLGGAANRRAIAGTPEAFWPGIPLGRIADPSWIAGAVTFLLGPQAQHITMHDLRVDGGATLGA